MRFEPQVDVFEVSDALIIHVALPLIRLSDITVGLAKGTGDLLVVKGERRLEKRGRVRRWHRREIPKGRFYAEIRLPDGFRLDPQQFAGAGRLKSNQLVSYEEGMLVIRIPKPEAKEKEKKA